MEEKIFIIVHDWVIQRLKSSEAMCYELIRSLCKDGSKYSGGAKYIAQRLGMTENAVSCILAKLRAMNVLEHEYITNGRGRYSAYWPNDENLAKALPKNLGTPTQETCIPITKKLGDPSPKNLGTPTQETWDNNKYNNKYNKENNKEYSSSTTAREEEEFVLDEKAFVQMFNKYVDATNSKIKRLHGLDRERMDKVKYLVDKYGVQEFGEFICKAMTSKFLNADGNEKWATFDWLINENNFLKVVEDNYKELYNDNKENDNGRADIGLAGKTANERVETLQERIRRENDDFLNGKGEDRGLPESIF